MKKKKRDEGLQPERTSMSWLRTHMITFGIGILLTKIGGYNNNILIELNGAALILVAFVGLFYSRLRFTQHFKCDEAVERWEITVKIGLSFAVAFSAIVYAITSLIRFFSPH